MTAIVLGRPDSFAGYLALGGGGGGSFADGDLAGGGAGAGWVFAAAVGHL